MTTTEFYREQIRLQEQGDVEGMLNLVGEHYGRLEGEFTEGQMLALGTMGSWALRLAEAEWIERMQARLAERYREQWEREGRRRTLLDLEPEPVKKPRFRWR